MLYQVTLYIPNPHYPYSVATQTRIVGSLKSARLRAASLLEPHRRFETDYSAKVNRGASVTITSARRFISDRMYHQGQPKEYRATYGHRETIEAPICYVPSIGERGY